MDRENIQPSLAFYQDRSPTNSDFSFDVTPQYNSPNSPNSSDSKYIPPYQKQSLESNNNNNNQNFINDDTFDNIIFSPFSSTYCIQQQQQNTITKITTIQDLHSYIGEQRVIMSPGLYHCTIAEFTTKVLHTNQANDEFYDNGLVDPSAPQGVFFCVHSRTNEITKLPDFTVYPLNNSKDYSNRVTINFHNFINYKIYYICSTFSRTTIIKCSCSISF